MNMDTVVLAEQLVMVSNQLKNLKVSDAELRKKMAEQLDDQPFEHEGYRFKKIPEKIISRINKKKLVCALSSAGLSEEIQEKIKLEAFDAEFKEAGVRMCKLK